MKNSYIHEQITPDAGLATKCYFCKVQQNPLHWHKELELLYCVKGELEVITSSSNTTLRSGDVILINRNVVHRVLGGNNDNISVIIQIDLNKLAYLEQGVKNISFICDSTLRKKEDFDYLKKLIKNFIIALYEKKEGYYLEIIAIRNYIILELIRSFKSSVKNKVQKEETDKSINRLVNILEYIEKNYKNKISLKEIADVNFLNSYYLSHYFHDKIGMSYRDYITYIRVYHAREFLLTTKKSIIDISLDCGFSSSQAFSRAFKAEFKKTPTQYRKTMTGLTLASNESTRLGHIWQALDPTLVLEHI